MVATCGWRLFQHWPVALGLVIAVFIAVLAAKRHFLIAAVFAAASSFVAGAAMESTKGAVWLALVAVLMVAVVIVQWAALIRPGRVDKGWWKTAERAERREVRQIAATWDEVTYWSGLTSADTRRRGMGYWRAHSERARRADRIDQIAEGDEARRITPTLLSITGSPIGYVLEVKPNTGQSADDWEAHADHLAMAWGAREVRIAKGAPGLLTVQIVVRDGLEAVTYYGDRRAVSLDAIPFGVDEDGNDVTIPLRESNLLLGGEPGAGKSGGQTCLLAGAASLPGVALIGIDPKRVELPPWAARFTTIVESKEDATKVLRALVEEMHRRYDWLKSQGLKKMTTFTDEQPFIMLVVDELSRILKGGNTKEEKDGNAVRADLLEELIAMGRAAGIFVSGATQKPDAGSVPTAIRDLVAQRMAYRTGGRPMTEVIVGAGRAQDAPAELIDPAVKGTGYLVSEGSTQPRLIRSLWIPDDEVTEWAERTSYLKPTWTLDLDGPDAEEPRA